MSDHGPSVGTGYRLAARLARREVLRRPGRTLLVALLVAVPVAGMFVADAMVRTDQLTPRQLWHSQWGAADAVFNGDQPADVARLTAALPAGTRVIPVRKFYDFRVLRVAGGDDTQVDISRVPLADPITNGIVQLMSGRLPAHAGEVFLTRKAARALHVRAGQTLRLTAPARHTFAVTGVGEFTDDWGYSSMIVTPGTVLPWKTGRLGPASLLVKLPAGADPHTLVQLERHWDRANEVLEASPAIGPTIDFGAADTQRKVRWSWVIGALVLTVTGIVIASAFAMGARRQLVTLGQLAANGAPPRTLRRVLFLQGTWTGLVGAVGGLGLGALALAALAPHVPEIFQRTVHPYTISATDVVPIFLLGVITATIAALLPSRTTSRLPVLAALAGRRPLGRVPRWLPVAGACGAVAGLALLGLAVLGARGTTAGTGHPQVWIATAIAGGVAVLLGACAITPAYVRVLEPLARRVEGSGRIAVRSLSRQRTRTGAVVSAIAATGALAIAATSLVLSAHLQDLRAAQYIRPDEVQLQTFDTEGSVAAPPPAFVAKARAILPRGTKELRTQVPTRPGAVWTITDVVADHPPTGSDPQTVAQPDAAVPVLIANAAVADDYGLRDSDRKRLTRSGALYLGESAGHVVISLVAHPSTTGGSHVRRFAAPMADGDHYSIASLPRLLVTPALAARLGMTARPGPVVFHAPKHLTGVQRTKLGNLESVMPSGQITYYIPPGGIDPLLVQWVLVGVALVMVLFVVAVNLALSAAETRDERDVLTVVGAAPAVLRRANGYKAALQTVMGSLLAIPVGFLPVVVFIAAASSHRPLVFPWAVVAMLVVGLPLVGGLITTTASGIALRLRPVRVSTMAYD